MYEACTPGFGTYVGKPSRAGASIGWKWKLAMANGIPTGRGTEAATVKLNFGGGKLVELSLKGQLSPVGKQSRDRGKTTSKGTCKIRSAKGFGKKRSAKPCTYRLSVTRNGSSYSPIVLRVSGAL